MLWVKTFFGILFQTALLAIFLYLPALTLNWPDALLFLTVHFLITILASAYLLIVKPASIEARMNYDSETQPKRRQTGNILDVICNCCRTIFGADRYFSSKPLF